MAFQRMIRIGRERWFARSAGKGGKAWHAAQTLASVGKGYRIMADVQGTIAPGRPSLRFGLNGDGADSRLGYRNDDEVNGPRPAAL
jgi:hypothetical protein